MKKRILALLLCAAALLSAIAFSGATLTEEDESGPCEVCGAENGHEVGCLETFTEVNKTARFAQATVTLYLNPIRFPEETMDFTRSDLPETFTVQYSFPDADGVIWYMLDTENWFEGTWEYTTYPYVRAEFVEIVEDTELTEQELTETVGDIGVTVRGDMPEDVALVASEASADGICDDPVAALDISLTLDGEDWQPSDAGTFVSLTLDVSNAGLTDGEMVTLYHLHDGETKEYTYVVINGELTFFTDSFSIYIVDKQGGTEETKQVNANSEYPMTVGQTETFYFKYTGNGTLLGCVWSVADTQNVVDYITYDNNNGVFINGTNNFWGYKAPWITVTAKRAGTVKLTLTYCYYTGNYWNPYDTGTEAFTIIVSEETGFHIRDSVAETGCLEPVWVGETEPDGVKYTWTRSDGQTVRSGAVDEENGSINISKDSGGVVNGRKPITYTVTAKQGDEVVGTAEYKVLYGNEILNPSFESPALPVDENHRAYPNGTKDLYWKTTAPGTSDKITSDIEIGSIQTSSNPYGITYTPDGKNQFAELNAEAVGALYQDILTTPGAELNWSFSHASRENKTNKMYIVIAATKDAQNIVDADSIAKLITAAGSGIPNAETESQGKKFEYNNGITTGTYYIWQHTSYASKWTTLSGTYTVPKDSNQYLTRLFFVSAPDSASKTEGNLIDGVSAGEMMNYRIEYYLNGNKEPDSTESGKATVYTSVTATKLSGYLKGNYVITNVTANGESYSGDVEKNGLFIMEYGDGGDITFKIHLSQRAITVTKVVEIKDDLTQDELESLLNGCKAVFGLFKEGQKEATETITLEPKLDSQGKITALGSFDSGKLENGVNYIVRETDHPGFKGYDLNVAYSGAGSNGNGNGITVTLTDNNPTAAITCTNTYTPSSADLTITKTGWDAIDENQSFVFHIEGNGVDMEVVIHGTGYVTIKGLPVGSYTVTEVTDWSWRYTPEKSEQTIDVKATGENTLTFANTRENGKWLSGGTYCDNRWKEANG